MHRIYGITSLVAFATMTAFLFGNLLDTSTINFTGRTLYITIAASIMFASAIGMIWRTPTLCFSLLTTAVTSLLTLLIVEQHLSIGTIAVLVVLLFVTASLTQHTWKADWREVVSIILLVATSEGVILTIVEDTQATTFEQTLFAYVLLASWLATLYRLKERQWSKK